VTIPGITREAEQLIDDPLGRTWDLIKGMPPQAGVGRGAAVVDDLVAQLGVMVSSLKAGALIKGPYKRPSGATTLQQRAAVQGQPCVDCGVVTLKQIANHIDELVKEWYSTGTIDLTKMRSVNAVNAHCPTCSAKQGAAAAQFSKQMKREHGF
jgi:hypothetical protein